MAQASIDLENVVDKIFIKRNKTISTKEAIELLKNDDGAINSMPFRPKDGERYLFKGERHTSNDYKADGHIW